MTSEHPYKDSCDHCGAVVDKRWWTFDLKQCVVCDDPECRAKQKEIVNKFMDDSTDRLLADLDRGEDIFK